MYTQLIDATILSGVDFHYKEIIHKYSINYSAIVSN